MKRTLKIVLYILLFSIQSVFCQDQTTGPSPSVLSFRPHYGWALIHTEKLEPLRGANPWGIELSFSKHYVNQKSWSYCNCYPRLGFSFYYWNFDKSALGNAYTGMFYVEPFFSFSNKINVSMRGAFGIAYLTNPFDEVSNPDNQAYSTNSSFPLLLSLSLNYNVNPYWNLVFSANYHHISNGGVKQPNYGINYPTLNLGLDYTLNPVDFPKREKVKFKDLPEKVNRWNLSIFGAYRDVESTDTTKRPVVGVNIFYSTQIATLSALAVGLDFAADYGVKYVVKNDPDKDGDFKRASVVIGNEFLLGRFNFFQYIGVYIYSPYKTADPVYQRYGLSFFVTKKYHMGFSLKAHREVAEYLDFRVGVVF